MQRHKLQRLSDCYSTSSSSLHAVPFVFVLFRALLLLSTTAIVAATDFATGGGRGGEPVSDQRENTLKTLKMASRGCVDSSGRSSLIVFLLFSVEEGNCVYICCFLFRIYTRSIYM